MIEYEVRGKMVVILGCSKDEVDIDLPDEIEGYPVSKIEANAFAEMDNLKKITIPGSVKVIGNYAFAACTNLHTVILEEGVEAIEDWAFISCGITRIALPQSLKSVGGNAFLGNEVKSLVEDFMNNKTSARRNKIHTNNKCCILPLSLLENKETINDEAIQNYSKYVDTQFDGIEDNSQLVSLDIPFVFDGDEFLLAAFNRKPLEDFSIEVANESKMTMGLYSENDPEYLILRVNVLTKGQFITSFTIKTPYLEAADFKIVNTTPVEAGGIYYYFIHVKANLDCFGNNNLDKAFALNQFDDLIGKYQTQLNNNIIKQDKFDYIMETISTKLTGVLSGFLSQIDGAPYMTYIVDVYRRVLEDQELDTTAIQEYVANKLSQYYSELSDYNSLERICFDLTESIEFITSATGMTLEELNAKYDTALVNGEGFPISEEDANNCINSFIDLDTNYKLHGDFLLYIYKELQRLNNEFSLFAFAE